MDSTERWALDDASGAALRVWDGWEQVPAPLGSLVAVARSDWRPGTGRVDCRPNVVVSAGPVAAGADIAELTTVAVAEALVGAERRHVLAYDLWPGNDTRPPGRRLCFAYQQDGWGIAVSQYLFVVDQILSVVTGTVGVDLADALQPFFDSAGSYARLPGRTSAA